VIIIPVVGMLLPKIASQQGKHRRELIDLTGFEGGLYQ
jgi:hypothetical protein